LNRSRRSFPQSRHSEYTSRHRQSAFSENGAIRGSSAAAWPNRLRVYGRVRAASTPYRGPLAAQPANAPRSGLCVERSRSSPDTTPASRAVNQRNTDHTIGARIRSRPETIVRTGPVTLLNLDEAALIIKGPGGTKKEAVGAKLTLKAKGVYRITMVKQAPDDNTLKLTIK
jgi:hypothetical protein